MPSAIPICRALLSRPREEALPKNCYAALAAAERLCATMHALNLAGFPARLQDRSITTGTGAHATIVTLAVEGAVFGVGGVEGLAALGEVAYRARDRKKSPGNPGWAMDDHVQFAVHYPELVRPLKPQEASVFNLAVAADLSFIEAFILGQDCPQLPVVTRPRL